VDETRRLSYVQRQELLYDRGHGAFEGRTVRGEPSELIERPLLDAYGTAAVTEAPGFDSNSSRTSG
jgi:hypothetical protein